MSKEFIFELRNCPSEEACKCCSAPAEFLAGHMGVETFAFCGICVAPFVLQTLKCKGVDLGMIETAFLKLSAAVDAPQESLLLQ